MSQTRQLAVIMFTDIVGYTALMGKDEQKAFELLNRSRAIQKPIIEKYSGLWIKEIGDGVMASFNTASDAVNAAMEIQEACMETQAFKLKVGLHMGEVVAENGDLFGDSVNIASMIEAQAVGSSILMSKVLRDQIKNNAELQLSSLGLFHFKNVREPLEIFALSNPGFVVPNKDSMTGKVKKTTTGTNKLIATIAGLIFVLSIVLFFTRELFFKGSTAEASRSLAILPFENLQMDSLTLYLSDGIPENLINRLSSFPNAKVFARSATFNLSDTSKSISSIRRLLNADAVLTGQLTNKDGVYYVSCQLVDAINQNQLWGAKYQMTNNDIAVIEDSIVASLINPLRIELAEKPKASTSKREQIPAAYAAYLKGRYLSYGATPEKSEEALNHFREAIRIDPKYALAYAAIANEKITQSIFSNAPKKEIIDEARTALAAAKALDPSIAEIYSTEGALKFYFDWDWEGAVSSFKKALQLDPGNAYIYIRYSATLANVGRYKEALPLADKAIELDPVSISSLHNLGWTNLLASNFEKSVEAFDELLELHPTYAWGYIKRGYGLVKLKQFDKAIANAQKAESLFGDTWGSELLQFALLWIYQNSNAKSKADTVIDRFMSYASENTIRDHYTMSGIYYLTGDDKNAYLWGEKAVDQRSPSAYLLNVAVIYDSTYFNSPEHQQILKRMGFVK